MANYKLIIPFIKRVEGGLSKAKTDTASKNPVPDGSGYHTNKGITWSSFTGLAKSLGYSATPELFYKMPDDVWSKIFKRGYWDAIRGDEITSQGMADTLVDWAWASGPGTAINKLREFYGMPKGFTMTNDLLKRVNKTTSSELKAFSEYKKKWYLSLPGQTANYKGWANRLDELYKIVSSYSVSILPVVVIIIFVLFLSLYGK